VAVVTADHGVGSDAGCEVVVVFTRNIHLILHGVIAVAGEVKAAADDVLMGFCEP
jgi:hypothetical protein